MNMKRVLIPIALALMLVFTMVNWSINDRNMTAQNLSPAQRQAIQFGAEYEARMGDVEDAATRSRVLLNGQTMCAYLDEDPDIDAAWDYGAYDLEMSGDQTSAVLEAAIHVYCPQHSNLLRGGY